MAKWLDKVRIGIMAAAVIGLIIAGILGINDALKNQNATTRQEGAVARESGVPAQANPYLGTRLRKEWLQGWIEYGQQKMESESPSPR